MGNMEKSDPAVQTRRGGACGRSHLIQGMDKDTGISLHLVLDALEQWERRGLSCSIPHLYRLLLDPEPVWNIHPRVCWDSKDLQTPVRAGSLFIRAAINAAK